MDISRLAAWPALPCDFSCSKWGRLTNSTVEKNHTRLRWGVNGFNAHGILGRKWHNSQGVRERVV